MCLWLGASQGNILVIRAEAALVRLLVKQTFVSQVLCGLAIHRFGKMCHGNETLKCDKREALVLLEEALLSL